MIDHFPPRIDADYANPVCLPLSPAMARFVRANEKPYPDASISVWRCNLCARHFEDQIELAGAIDHVRKVYVGLPCRYYAQLKYAVTASEHQRSV